jgi:hypothetical protein
MLNKGAESLPAKDAQAFKQLAVKKNINLEISRFQKFQKGSKTSGKIIVNLS